YQGMLGRVDEKLIRGLERVTIGDLKPDLTFILDVPVDIGLARTAKRRGEDNADRFEAETRDFHEKLRVAYRDLAAKEPVRCVVINAEKPRNDVANQIWKIVYARLDPISAPAMLEDTAS